MRDLALRCECCDLNWPMTRANEVCQVCGLRTAAEEVQSMTLLEAAGVVTRHTKRVAAYREFENYYLKRALVELHAELDNW